MHIALKGISIADRDIIISQLADDTTLFLKNSCQAPIAIKTIESFSAAPGLCLNLNKCEIFLLKDCNIQHVANIPVKEKVTYIGITIVKNEEERCSENLSLIIDKRSKKFNQWLQRNLSLKGRMLLIRQKAYLI